MDQSRRRFLAYAGLAPFAVMATRAAAAEGVCYTPESLPFSQKTRRRSIGFVEVSPHADQRCGLCAFFTAGEGACGSCQMLSGGPVTAAGFCNSFAPKG